MKATTTNNHNVDQTQLTVHKAENISSEEASAFIITDVNARQIRGWFPIFDAAFSLKCGDDK